MIHILHFLYFAENSQRPDGDEEYDRLQKLQTVFNKLNEVYAKFYNPLEHLAVDDVSVNSRAGLSLGRTFLRKENILASKFTNSVMNQGICMT